VQSRRDIDVAAADALVRRLRPELTGGANIALDLRQVRVDPEHAASAIQGLVEESVRGKGRLVIVEADDDRRHQLTAAGVAPIYESLDEALQVTEAPLREGAASVPEPLHPSTWDTTLPRVDE
jgi:hypothetical protein